MLSIGTLSVMVNAVCNLKCLHCDLPRRYGRYGGALSPEMWSKLVRCLRVLLGPKNLTVGAMEPLMPHDQEKTAAIISAAQGCGMNAGLITNGIFLRQFHDRWPELCPDFLDISVDGSEEIDRKIRGEKHFKEIEKILESDIPQKMTSNFYISCCLNDLNIPHLPAFLDWIRSRVVRPRLVLIALYSNRNVEPIITLSESSLRRGVQIVSEAEGFEEIIIDFFPNAPGLEAMRMEGMLPSLEECKQDASGVECGWVGDSVYSRFYNMNDLLLHQLRISPEGHALTPTGYENPDYLAHSLGSLVSDDWSVIEGRITKAAIQFENERR